MVGLVTVLACGAGGLPVPPTDKKPVFAEVSDRKKKEWLWSRLRSQSRLR